MPLLKVLPFVTLDPSMTESVTMKQWMLGEIELAQVNSVRSWSFDPAAVEPQDFSRVLDIEPSAFANELSQGKAAHFRLVVEVRSSHTGIRDTYVIRDFSATDADFRETIRIEIQNSETGGRLTFLTRVVLKRPDPIESTSAALAGCVVFQETMLFDMEDYFDGFPHLEPGQLNNYLGLTPGPKIGRAHV